MIRANSLPLSESLPIQVADWWRDAVSDRALPPSGSDVTATPEWHAALARAFLPNGGGRLVVVQGEDDSVAALLPVYRRTVNASGIIGETIALLTELYGGRVACLAAADASDAVQHVFKRLSAEFPRWSCLQMTLVDGNPTSARFLETARTHNFAIASERLPRAPYIALSDSFAEYFKTLKANFRTEVRRGERRLRELGDLTTRIFTTPDDVEPLWQAVCSIERASWKEDAGTSITRNPFQERFYREFLPLAAATRQLLSTVLYLDGRPVAHKLCVARDSVASVLKMSYVDDLRRFYPSTVLLASYLSEIIEHGVRFVDFMGVCDDFKMRWTSLTYGRTKHLIFRDSVAGRLAWLRHRLSRGLEFASFRLSAKGAKVANE